VRFEISRKELSIWSDEIVPAGGGGLRGGLGFGFGFGFG
jgi:hypothetical protein